MLIAQLTNKHGTKIYVNLYNVSYMVPQTPSGSAIFVFNELLFVNESIEEILKLIP